jgi:hypothetical protein
MGQESDTRPTQQFPWQALFKLIPFVWFNHSADCEEFVNLRVWATGQPKFYFNHLILYSSNWSAPGLSKPTFEEAMQQKFKPAKKVGVLFAFLVSYLKRSV